MSDTECPHGMGHPDWCSICKHGPAKPEPVTVEYRITAKFDGDCRECGLVIYSGQCIACLSDGRFVHDGCVS